MKRIICALAAALLVLTGCSTIDVADQTSKPLQTSSQPEPEAKPPAEPVSELRLAYDMNDSMNPYEMTTQLNRALTPLLYDSLTRPDKTYQPENMLAEEVTMNGTVCTVKFRRGAQFSDGTFLTGKDIVYSVSLASSTEGNYKQMLRNVVGSSVNEDGDVEIRLQREDADFPLLLSFPIVKENTGKSDYPVGVSKFFVSGTWGNTGITLSANPLYYGGAGNIRTVKLVGVSDPDALNFNLKTGDIDLSYSDLSMQELGNLSASSKPVSINNMVYLGVNSGHGLLGRPEFRTAISTALNRDELVAKAYNSWAVVTQYPFHPDFYRMQGIELSVPRNLTAADALLDGIGLTETDAEGFRLQNGKPVTLTLLVNTENTYRNAVATLISEQLRQVGIKVNVVSQSFSQYQSSLSYHSFDLYVGEVRMTDNMDFSMLLNGGSLGYACAYDEGLAGLYAAYKRSGQGIEELCGRFADQSVFIPLLFRQGMVSFNREFRAEMVATEHDIFYNIMEW